jgi:plastocyanin domain-containing protein
MLRVAAAALLSISLGAFAAGEPEFNLALEGHKFTPDRIEVPAGKKVKLVVENKDATPEEFDSSTLKIEKVIPGKSKATIFVGPLKPGEYKFAGEYNAKTAQGVIVAK